MNVVFTRSVDNEKNVWNFLFVCDNTVDTDAYADIVTLLQQ